MEEKMFEGGKELGKIIKKDSNETDPEKIFKDWHENFVKSDEYINEFLPDLRKMVGCDNKTCSREQEDKIIFLQSEFFDGVAEGIEDEE